MIKWLREQWRTIHIDSNTIRLTGFLRFDKRKLKIYTIKNVVPNLIIVGSQKCGTSSLHNYLNTHPDIHMSFPEKEPAYFIFDEWGKLFWNEHRGKIVKSKIELKKKYMIGDKYANQKYCGESTTYYTVNDYVTKYKISEKIKRESPNAKIIYIIRNPFERVISHFNYLVQNKYYEETASLNDYLNNMGGWLKTTKYYDQIKPFINVSESDVKLVLFEELKNEPQETMNNIYKFLGLPPNLKTSYEVNNKTSLKKKSKISLDVFNKLEPIFLEEKKKLEMHFGFELSWDLSRDTWAE